MKMDIEAYCMRCKKKKIMKDAQQVKTRYNTMRWAGKCPDCGTGMSRMISSKK